jgi:hypothetical protein
LTTTYAGDPSASTKDRLRFMLGDTGPDRWQLTDEEIAAQLTLSAGIFSAAADLAEALAARFAPKGSISIEGLGIGSGQARYYLDLAKSYRAQAVLAGEGTSDTPPGSGSTGVGAPVATGLSVSDIIANDRDYDRVPSRFSTAREGYGGHGGYGYRGWW